LVYIDDLYFFLANLLFIYARNLLFFKAIIIPIAIINTIPPITQAAIIEADIWLVVDVFLIIDCDTVWLGVFNDTCVGVDVDVNDIDSLE